MQLALHRRSEKFRCKATSHRDCAAACPIPLAFTKMAPRRHPMPVNVGTFEIASMETRHTMEILRSPMVVRTQVSFSKKQKARDADVRDMNPGSC